MKTVMSPGAILGLGHYWLTHRDRNKMDDILYTTLSVASLDEIDCRFDWKSTEVDFRGPLDNRSQFLRSFIHTFVNSPLVWTHARYVVYAPEAR